MLPFPYLLAATFIIITLVTLPLLYNATGRSKMVLVISVAWLLLQAMISLTGFYTLTNTMPPRFLLNVVPPFLFIIWVLNSNKSKEFLANCNIAKLTLLHMIRIPVELGLYFLSVEKWIPGLMTFEGSNFDILAGCSAPFIWYFGFVRKKLPAGFLLAWNFICIGLLANIVIRAILSAPFPFQQLAFDQPNVAILYFPFSWLPCFIVPVVLFAHLVTIRSLLQQRAMKKLHITRQSITGNQ